MRPPPDVSESDFLAHQARQAQKAMRQVLDDIGHSLKDTVNLRAWAEQHPIAMLGAAAAAGFVTASAVTPSRDETVAERLRRLAPERPAPAEAPSSGEEPQKKHSLFQKISGPLFEAVQAALVSAVTTAVNAKVQQEPQQPHDGDGNAENIGP